MTVFYFDGQILGKAEFLNPGGSVKDRIAVKIIEEVFQGKKNFPFFVPFVVTCILRVLFCL